MVVAGAMACLALWLPTTSGCAGFETWPPIEPGDRIPNRDEAAIGQTMTAALARVIQDYPPRGDSDQMVAINLPAPLVTEAVYRRVAREIEAELGGTRMVSPLSEAGINLPVYHVAGVRIRTGKAEIDVLRPVFGVDELDRAELTNDEAYEGYTVRLSGGLRPWHVTWVERFTPGIISAPAINPIDQAAPAQAADEPASEPAAEQTVEQAAEPGQG